MRACRRSKAIYPTSGNPDQRFQPQATLQTCTHISSVRGRCLCHLSACLSWRERAPLEPARVRRRSIEQTSRQKCGRRPREPETALTMVQEPTHAASAWKTGKRTPWCLVPASVPGQVLALCYPLLCKQAYNRLQTRVAAEAFSNTALRVAGMQPSNSYATQKK